MEVRYQAILKKVGLPNSVRLSLLVIPDRNALKFNLITIFDIEEFRSFIVCEDPKLGHEQISLGVTVCLPACASVVLHYSVSV